MQPSESESSSSLVRVSGRMKSSEVACLTLSRCISLEASRYAAMTRYDTIDGQQALSDRACGDSGSERECRHVKIHRALPHGHLGLVAVCVAHGFFEAN